MCYSFWCNCKWNYFLNFSFYYLLLVCINTTDFCILIWYPATLLNSSLVLIVFCWSLQSILYTVSCHLQIMTVLLISYQFGCLLFPFLVLWLYRARNSSTLLNKRGESGHPCLVPDLIGNAFSFSLLSMMLAVRFSYMAFIMLFVSSKCTLLRVFIMLYFVKCFFCIY